MPWVGRRDVLPSELRHCLAFVTCACDVRSPPPPHSLFKLQGLVTEVPDQQSGICQWILKPQWMFSKIVGLSQTHSLPGSRKFPSGREGTCQCQSISKASRKCTLSGLYPTPCALLSNPSHGPLFSHSVLIRGSQHAWGGPPFKPEGPVTSHSPGSPIHLLL